jgi:hypothetical protein
MAVSPHEEVARLRGFIMAEDREWVVVAGIRQGVSVALVAMQLRIEVNLHWVVSGFADRVRLKERAELVNDFTTTADTIVAAMDVEEVIRGHD